MASTFTCTNCGQERDEDIDGGCVITNRNETGEIVFTDGVCFEGECLQVAQERMAGFIDLTEDTSRTVTVVFE